MIKRNEHGRRIGESHHNAKYSDHECELVIRLHEEGFSVRAISRMMEMPRTTVWVIVKGLNRNQIPRRIEDEKTHR